MTHFLLDSSNVPALSFCSFWCAFGLYCVNLVVGAIAQARWYHFGRAHHVLYFVVFAAALVAAVLRFHPAFLLTLAALALMPKTRSQRLLRQPFGPYVHPLLAFIGLVGYCLVMVRGDIAIP
jgi:hypothetical protein